MRVKITKAYIAPKNERVSKDSSLVPAGTTLDVTPERASELIAFGYVDAPTNKAKKFKK